MKSIFKILLILPLLLIISGCESELDKEKKKNTELHAQIKNLKADVNRLKLEGVKLNNKLTLIKKIYNVDASGLQNGSKKPSGVFNSVFSD